MKTRQRPRRDFPWLKHTSGHCYQHGPRDMTHQGRNQIHDKETHLPLNLDQGCLIVGHLLKTANQATEAVCEVVRAGGLDTPATHSLSASIALRLPTSTSAPASVRRAECSDAASSSQPESPSEPSEPLQQVELATEAKNPITGTLTESGLCIDFEPFCLESQSKFS